MTKKKTTTPASDASNDELIGLIPAIPVRPWEDGEAFKRLEIAVEEYLSPSTVHKKALARDILACLWETFRVSDLDQNLSVYGYRQAISKLLGDPIEEFASPCTEVKMLAMALTTPKTRDEALGELRKHLVDENDVKAMAYLETMHESAALHRRLATLEERRRALMSEYRELCALPEKDAGAKLDGEKIE